MLFEDTQNVVLTRSSLSAGPCIQPARLCCGCKTVWSTCVDISSDHLQILDSVSDSGEASFVSGNCEETHLGGMHAGGIAEQSWPSQVRELEYRLSRSKARWKIVVGHHPVRNNRMPPIPTLMQVRQPKHGKVPQLVLDN